MAAITKVDPAPCSPPGYELNDAGYASTALAVGDPVVITAAAPPSRKWEQVIAKATGTAANGIALKDVAVGGTAEYGVVGEMDGFSGLTRGAGLTIVAGAIDNTAPAVGVVPQVRAVTASRIRYSLV